MIPVEEEDEAEETSAAEAAEAAELRRILCDTAEHNRVLDGECSALEETLRRLGDDQRELLERLSSAEEERSALAARLDARTRRAAETREQVLALQRDNETLTREIGAAERLLERLREQEAEVGSEVARCRVLASSARETLDRIRESIMRMDFKLRHGRRR